MRTGIAIFVVGFSLSLAPVEAQEAVTVSDVLSMASAGLSEDLIIASIRKTGKPANLNTSQMIQLKKANVSDAVIKAMLDPSSAASVVVVSSGSASHTASIGNPNDPSNPHESGIYALTKDRDGKEQMILLERAAYQGSKTGGLWKAQLTAGIMKAKVKAIIPGARATVRLQDASPVFYFYFEDRGAGLGKGLLAGNLTSPNQFALVKLEINKSNRETVTTEAGAFGGSTGTDAKAMVSFRSERIRPGVYKVSVSGLLADGEYCFIAGLAGTGAAVAVDIFDFGIAAH
jgi:hypothetical protein